MARGGHQPAPDLLRSLRLTRAVPQLPSPIVFQNVLYMVNDGGIVTTLNPETGELIKQGRLTGALGAYYSSPVAAGGYLYFTSERGAVAVLPIFAKDVLHTGPQGLGALRAIALYRMGSDSEARAVLSGWHFVAISLQVSHAHSCGLISTRRSRS